MIPIHRLIRRPQAESLLAQFTGLSPGSAFALLGLDGSLFAGSQLEDQDPQIVEEHIQVGNETLARLLANAPAAQFLPALHHSLTLLFEAAVEKRDIARETLDRYREINLLYQTAETIGACLDSEEIPGLVIKEALRAIPASAGLVLLYASEGKGELELRAEFPPPGEPSPSFQRVAEAGSSMLLKYTQPLIDQVLSTSRPDIRNDLGPYTSVLCAPLKSRERVLGAVILARQKPETGKKESQPLSPLLQREDLYSSPLFTAGDEKLLMALATQAGIAIEKAWMHQQELQRQRMEQELALGQRIQRSLLPQVTPRLPGWEFTAFYQAARQVGGDFYDFFLTTPDSGPAEMGLLVADVTGKGVPAALMMAFSRAVLSTVLRYSLPALLSPAELLRQVNRYIVQDNRTGLLLTALYASLDPLTGRLSYANAGHERPMLLSDSTGECIELESRGVLLGAFLDISLEERQVELQHGDLLVLYTDGVTEARDPLGNLFGEEQLISAIRGCKGLSSEVALQTIMTEVQSFCAGTPQSDDFTMMVVRRSPDSL